MADSPKLCNECNAVIQPGTKFCTECGKPVEDTSEDELEPSKSVVKCPQCNAVLNAEDKFCTECKAKIEPITDCPKCNAPVKPGTTFCTECGTNVNEYQPTMSTSTIQTGTKITDLPHSTTSKRKDEPMEDIKETGMGLMKDVEKTGKGLMKDLGSFLDKSSSKSKNTIKPTKKNQRFLVCDKCLGYYELQKGESAEDFSDECECGGHLEEKDQHP